MNETNTTVINIDGTKLLKASTERVKVQAQMNLVIASMLRQFAGLLEGHQDEIAHVISEEEPQKLKVGMSAMIDMSEANTKVTTGIQFSKTVKDSDVETIADPNQPDLPFDEDAAADPDAEPETDEA